MEEMFTLPHEAELADRVEKEFPDLEGLVQLLAQEAGIQIKASGEVLATWLMGTARRFLNSRWDLSSAYVLHFIQVVVVETIVPRHLHHATRIALGDMWQLEA